MKVYTPMIQRLRLFFLTGLFAFFSVVFISCNNDDPSLTPTPNTPVDNTPTTTNAQPQDEDEADLEKPEYEVSDFVWRAMNFFYFWQEDVALLANSKYKNRNEYIKMIKENADPVAFFNKMLYKEGMVDGDRFSWFIEDYEEQEKSFQGVSKDHGMQFGLSYIDREVNDNLVAYVQLVYPKSNAEKQGVERGMLFTHVNDETLHPVNYRTLLYGEADSFTITLANYSSDNGFENTDTQITLTKQVDFARDPIVFHSIIETGNLKIGYLFYNQFVSNDLRHQELNDVFGELKENNIDELIVDLRYNRGGSLGTQTLIASAISGKGAEDIMSKSFWNRNILDAWYDGADSDDAYFYDHVPLRNSEAIVNIHKLDLERVYFITSRSTASASEQLINNLKPYMDVIQVGDVTVGKNDGSFTLYDVEDKHPSWYASGYKSNRENNDEINLNPNHKNALQPLVVKSGNSDGFYQFGEGLQPDHSIRERILSLGTLGDNSEPLLARVLQEIVPRESRFSEADYYVGFEILDRAEDKRGIMIYDLGRPTPKQE